MRKVREVLRLRHALSLSYREISEALSVGKTSVGEIVRRADVVGLTWPLPQLVDDGELERRLFTAAGEAQPERPAPDWATLHEELKRRSVTLVLLWQEYRAEHPDGYGYSRFCDLYGEWRRSVSATMRQTHVAGEKLFVDFAGDTVAVIRYSPYSITVSIKLEQPTESVGRVVCCSAPRPQRALSRPASFCV